MYYHHELGSGIEMNALIDAVLARSSGKCSLLHGVDHWKRVAAAGHALLQDTPGADQLLVFLFALFHDSMRLTDGYDPDHGPRAGVLVRQLRAHLPKTITAAQIDTLVYACNEHTFGGITTDPTVGVCWDADRLNLWRVGIRPDPLLLSTPAAKRSDCILWGRELQERHYTWDDLLESYRLK
jgi:uncharacterized protein